MTTAVRLVDVRADMPHLAGALEQRRAGQIVGLAIHHSATANPANGLSLDTARAIFEQHVAVRGWDHGAYHYLVQPNGLVEYALDEQVPGYHAGFSDPDDSLGLERGQYWNQHYLAVCLLGWFDTDRTFTGPSGELVRIPNYFTRPTRAQQQALLGLIAQLRQRHAIPIENIRGHRELAGSRTRCPGHNLDLDVLRAAVCSANAAAGGQPAI